MTNRKRHGKSIAAIANHALALTGGMVEPIPLPPNYNRQRLLDLLWAARKGRY